MLSVKKEKQNKKLTVILTGKLDALTALELEEALKNELDDIDELIFDLKNLEYISSPGLRILLFCSKKMLPDKIMVIKNVNEVVKDVLNMTGFDSFLTIE